MITTIHSYGGVTATVYVMQKSEKIPRHQHTFAHTTAVAAGQSEVEVYGDSLAPFVMLVGDAAYELPAGIDHEIRALEDGTVVVNIAKGLASNFFHQKDNPSAGGGILLEDGTVVNADTP